MEDLGTIIVSIGAFYTALTGALLHGYRVLDPTDRVVASDPQASPRHSLLARQGA
jgi:hypothetical protein